MNRNVHSGSSVARNANNSVYNKLWQRNIYLTQSFPHHQTSLVQPGSGASCLSAGEYFTLHTVWSNSWLMRLAWAAWRVPAENPESPGVPSAISKIAQNCMLCLLPGFFRPTELTDHPFSSSPTSPSPQPITTENHGCRKQWFDEFVFCRDRVLTFWQLKTCIFIYIYIYGGLRASCCLPIASQISSLFSTLCHSLQHQGVIYLLFETRYLLFHFYPF